MDTQKPLSIEQAAIEMTKLKDGWDFHEGKLRRWFNFKDFKETMAFVNKVAGAAEAAGHHPEMHVSYNKVLIELFTHDVHGLSEKDFKLAAQIDQIAE